MPPDPTLEVQLVLLATDRIYGDVMPYESLHTLQTMYLWYLSHMPRINRSADLPMAHDWSQLGGLLHTILRRAMGSVALADWLLLTRPASPYTSLSAPTDDGEIAPLIP